MVPRSTKNWQTLPPYFDSLNISKRIVLEVTETYYQTFQLFFLLLRHNGNKDLQLQSKAELILWRGDSPQTV